MLFNVKVYGNQDLRKDFFTRTIFALIIGFLVLVTLQLTMTNTSVQAQSSSQNISSRNIYVEPGTVTIRTPDGGGTIGDGKLVIDLNTGNAWGFPTNLTGSPYPVDPINGKPPVSKPIYLGKFDFSQMKTP